jgi:hypothetical protein
VVGTWSGKERGLSGGDVVVCKLYRIPSPRLSVRLRLRIVQVGAWDGDTLVLSVDGRPA